MPTSVRGRYSSSGGARGLGGGFTLIEILLVVMIIGIGASLIVPGFATTRVSAKDEAERIVSLMDHAQMLAGLRGVPLAWQATADGYGFLDFRGAWKPLEKDRTLKHRDLPPELTLTLVASASRPKADFADPNAGSLSSRDKANEEASPLLVFPPNGYMRPFTLTVTGIEGAWKIVGDAAGRLSLVDAAEH